MNKKQDLGGLCALWARYWVVAVGIAVVTGFATGCEPKVGLKGKENGEKTEKLEKTEKTEKKEDKGALNGAGGAGGPTEDPASAAKPQASHTEGMLTPLPLASSSPLSQLSTNSATETSSAPSLAGVFTLAGEVFAESQASLSFRVPGFMAAMRRRPGESCSKGEPLAKLEEQSFAIALAKARGQRDLARTAARFAKAESDREEELWRKDASSEVTRERQKLSYEKARLEEQQAGLVLQEAEQAMADTELRAPFDCVIVESFRSKGESIRAGEPVFKVYGQKDLTLRFVVPERMVGQFKVGQGLRVRVPASGFEGVLPIQRLVPYVDDKSRSFRLILAAPERPEMIPGLYAEASGAEAKGL